MVILTELLPESSSSSSSSTHVYDVFLSFRGADTRNRFTDHLYNALLDAGFNTFLDDAEIETGNPLKPELETAIKSSRASVIVLSKNYASSTWCLDELVLILHQSRNCNQIVIPIFYDVEPTHVRKQQSSFGEAMAKHEQKMEAETDAEKRSHWGRKMEIWKRALTEVADLKGKDAKNKKETELIKEVIADIHHRLRVPLSNTLPRLIGMDDHIRSIGSWLTDGSGHTADIVTIVGISGIGKTSLARYVFGLHSSKFHKSSFIEGINAKCTDCFNGLHDLQKQLCGDISKNVPLQVHDVSGYTSKIQNALARERVFLVLDDVGNFKQLDALLGHKGLHPGSKIVITTKDASVTKKCALFKSLVHPNHTEVLLNGLWEPESLELLCSHAFDSQEPKEGYKEVLEELVKYCQGHPLALEVLGSSLREQDVEYWEECIEVLKKEPHFDINEALKISFDTLPSKNDKELFKHIACFFVGMDRDVTDTILNSCDIMTRSGIRHLTDRCLLCIGWNNELMMHQLVQEMGRDLVRQESCDKPWKRSRLWCHEESLKVIQQKKVKGNLLGLALDMRMLDKKKLYGSIELETKSLSKMDNLMLLQLNYVQLNGCFQNFPEKLRWLCMHGSPLKSIPLDLPMENLVVFDFSYSNIESFYMSHRSPQPPVKRQTGLIGSSSKDRPLLGSLKILDLNFCKLLHSVGGLSEVPALEKLILRNCVSLIKLGESIGQCVELDHINLSYCYKLKNIPASIRNLKKVKSILLDGCNYRESQIETIPRALKLMVVSLPSSLKKLSLENNNLSNESFPMDWSCLEMLEELCLDDNPIVSMPNCVRTLPRLHKLSLNNCKMLTSIEHPPLTLRELSIFTLGKNSVSKVKFDEELSSLLFVGFWIDLSCLPLEIDGLIKIEGMTGVEEKVLHSLGWKNLDFTKERSLITSRLFKFRRVIAREPQLYYEFGIFSTFYWGKGMPEWINDRRDGPSISFTIPSSPNNLRGLNFCCITKNGLQDSLFYIPMIKISNVTQNHTWIYRHYVDSVKSKKKGKRLCWLSHWMFGENEMKDGDRITINLKPDYDKIKECGIGLVYDEDEKMEEEEEEDVLGYYKSWNRIIGGDLSPCQLTTGEYLLENNLEFIRYSTKIDPYYRAFINDSNARYKEKEVTFKPFSQRQAISWILEDS